jgi:hypothetical protein
MAQATSMETNETAEAPLLSAKPTPLEPPDSQPWTLGSILSRQCGHHALDNCTIGVGIDMWHSDRWDVACGCQGGESVRGGVATTAEKLHALVRAIMSLLLWMPSLPVQFLYALFVFHYKILIT